MSNEITYEPTFEAFWMFFKTITQDPPLELKEKLHEGMQKVGLITNPTTVTALAKPTPKGGRRTGYNVYQTTRNAQLKAEGLDGTARSARILTEWKAMNATDKAVWNKQGTGGTVVSKTLSGYNLYVTAENRRLKALNPNEKQNYLPVIAKQWKELPQEQKDEWKAKAKLQSTGGAPVAPAPVPIGAPITKPVIKISMPKAPAVVDEEGEEMVEEPPDEEVTA